MNATDSISQFARISLHKLELTLELAKRRSNTHLLCFYLHSHCVVVVVVRHPLVSTTTTNTHNKHDDDNDGLMNPMAEISTDSLNGCCSEWPWHFLQQAATCCRSLARSPARFQCAQLRWLRSARRSAREQWQLSRTGTWLALAHILSTCKGVGATCTS